MFLIRYAQLESSSTIFRLLLNSPFMVILMRSFRLFVGRQVSSSNLTRLKCLVTEFSIRVERESTFSASVEKFQADLQRLTFLEEIMS